MSSPSPYTSTSQLDNSPPCSATSPRYPTSPSWSEKIDHEYSPPSSWAEKVDQEYVVPSVEVANIPALSQQPTCGIGGLPVFSQSGQLLTTFGTVESCGVGRHTGMCGYHDLLTAVTQLRDEQGILEDRLIAQFCQLREDVLREREELRELKESLKEMGRCIGKKVCKRMVKSGRVAKKKQEKEHCKGLERHRSQKRQEEKRR